MFSVKIDNQELGEHLLFTDVDRGFFPPIETKTRDFQLQSGARLLHNRYEKRIISLSFVVKGEVDKKIELAKRILTRRQVFEVTFGDFPDRYFVCVLSGESEHQKESRYYAKGKINLLAVTPFAISKIEKKARRDGSTLVFENLGTAPVYPIYRMTATKNIKMFGMTHPSGKSVQYGYANTSDFAVRTRDVVIFDSSANKLTINGNRKYINLASQVFAINPGTTEIGVISDSGSLVELEASFREVYL